MPLRLPDGNSGLNVTGEAMRSSTNSEATGRDSMHAESQKRESSTATRGLGQHNQHGQPGKHKLPDPPDPDNLPIDYMGSGWDSSRYPSSTPQSLRPTHSSRRRSA